MKIKDIMKRDPVTMQESDPLHLARSTMAWLQSRHLPVLRAGRLVGILSERDLLAYGARCAGEDWLTAPIDQAMHRDPQTCGPEDSVTEVAGRMADAKIGCLPVVELGQVIGLVTSTDVLAAQVFEAMRPVQPSALTARDVMTPDPATVHPDDHVLDAAARMHQLSVRHLLVVDGTSRLIGIISDRDVRRAIGNPIDAMESTTQRVRIAAIRVQDVMTAAVQTAAPEEAVSDLARRFVQRSIGALPVLDPEGHPIGIVSYVDALEALAG
jgi:CBS domain-containing protein